MTFAQTLQKLMDRDGLTNYQLAKKLECHQTSIKNWLDGSKPQKLMMKKIADFFNVSVDYLLGNEQKEKPTTVSDDELEDDLSEDDLSADEKLLLAMYRDVPDNERAVVLAGIVTELKKHGLL